MTTEFDADESFPTWLTLSWAWEQTMEDPEAVKSAIARNLRSLREARALSQKSLASRVRENLSTIKAIESAKLLPSIGQMAEFARVLEVPCTALTDGDPAAVALHSLPRRSAGGSARQVRGVGKTLGNRLSLRPFLRGRAI
jgi:DNA-binding XRE family transcriptional regulator